MESSLAVGAGGATSPRQPRGAMATWREAHHRRPEVSSRRSTRRPTPSDGRRNGAPADPLDNGGAGGLLAVNFPGSSPKRALRTALSTLLVMCPRRLSIALEEEVSR